MWIVLGTAVAVLALIGVVIDIRDRTFRSRVNKDAIREGRRDAAEKAARYRDSSYGNNLTGFGP